MNHLKPFLNPFIGLICNECNFAFLPSNNKEAILNWTHYKLHVGSYAHMNSVQDKNKMATKEEYESLNSQYMSDCEAIARKIVKSLPGNDKCFLDEYIEEDTISMYICSCCEVEFFRNKKCRHMAHCSSSVREMLNMTGQYCKAEFSTKKKFIGSYQSLTIVGMIEQNIFCKDVQDKICELMYWEGHKHDKPVVIPSDPSFLVLGKMPAITLISGIANFIMQQKQQLDEWQDDEKIIGYTRINGGRLEIFFDYYKETKHCSLLWVKVVKAYITATNLKYTHGYVTNAIKSYCSYQQMKDSRIEHLHEHYQMKYKMNISKKIVMKLSNYSMILSFSACSQQLLHLDALFPNFQFFLSCTNDSPTNVHCQITKGIEINCIIELINSNTILEGIDDELKHLLHCNQKVREFMSDYGHLFNSKTPSESELVSIGSVVSLPGSVIHAGPACNDPRAIIFFTSGFIGKKAEAMNEEMSIRNAPIHELYKKHVEFNTVSLFIAIMASVWPEIKDAKHKQFLLTKLHHLIMSEGFKYDEHATNAYAQSLVNYIICCKQNSITNILLNNVMKAKSLLLK